MGKMNSRQELAAKLAMVAVASLFAADLTGQVSIQISAHTKLTAGNRSVAKGTVFQKAYSCSMSRLDCLVETSRIMR